MSSSLDVRTVIIYSLIIVYVLILPFLVRSIAKDTKNLQKHIAAFGMLGIFLLLALKARTVGCDITGYESQYYIAQLIDWEKWDDSYFEKGYILLEKIFSKAGFGFQLFAASIYGLQCFAWYKLISKYSSDARISLLFFICYQFMVFSMSGLRQTLSMTICIFAFLVLQRDTIFSLFLSIVIMLGALSIHSGAFAFIAVILIWILSRNQVDINIISVVMAISAVSRPFLQRFIDSNLRKTTFDFSFFTSGNSLFLFVIFILSILTFYLKQKNTYRNNPLNIRCENMKDRLALRFMLYAVLGLFMFSGSTVMRCVMYITTFIPMLLPEIIHKYKPRTQTFFKICLGAVLIFIFFNYSIIPNQFLITPYKFFWEIQ